jgi:hypothetical protein
MDKNWLLAETAGIDDALFFQWDYAEVVTLLRAVNEALSKPEDKKDKKENRSRGDGGG